LFGRQTIAENRKPATRRGIAVVLFILAYLLSGMLHGVIDVDEAYPLASQTLTALDQKVPPTSEKGALADHHCHGCFSMSMPELPEQFLRAIEPETVVFTPFASVLSDSIRDLDPPPPKYLTRA